jgi:hypothetical protein
MAHFLQEGGYALTRDQKDMANGFMQAFQQAPWRVQIQKLGLILLGLVIFGLTAGIYLNISANSYAKGVEAQEYDDKRDEYEREIADLQTEKAMDTISNNMEKRAGELGFKTPVQEDLVYLIVPGYAGRQLDIKTSPSEQEMKRSLIKPAFTQSLWEYLVQSVLLMGNDLQAGGSSQ